MHEGYQQVVWTADQQEVYLLQQQQQLGQQQYQPNEDVGYTPTGFFGGQWFSFKLETDTGDNNCLERSLYDNADVGRPSFERQQEVNRDYVRVAT